MTKKQPKEQAEPTDIVQRPRNPFQGIGDRCRLSERTVRNAFARKPITWHTARILAGALRIDMGHFRIKEDRRGLDKKRLSRPPGRTDGSNRI